MPDLGTHARGDTERRRRHSDDAAPGSDHADPTLEAVTALRQHPQFVPAMRAMMQVPLDLYQGNRLVNALISDRGRYNLAVLALHLHYSRKPDDPTSGLTAPRLQTLCAEHGLCSSGRAGAVIRLLCWTGYLASAAAAADRRLRLLVPTERLIEVHRARWRRQIRAVALMLPEADEALAHFDHPAFLPAYATVLAREFLAGFRHYKYAPEVRLFTDRNAGRFILYSIALAGAADDAVPPTRAVTVSASALAKRFHVSRSHVIGLLRDAVDGGLLERFGPNEFRMTPHLRAATETLVAKLLLITGTAAQAAFAAVQRAGESADPARQAEGRASAARH